MSKVITGHVGQSYCRRIIWITYCKFCTFVIPDVLLIHLSNGRLATKARREAWREKVALFLTYLIVATMFCFWLEYITELFCDIPPTYDYLEIYSKDSDMATINGAVVDWKDLENSTKMTQTVNSYPHRDLSPLFPTFMLLHRDKDENTYKNKAIDNCINGFSRSAEADNWLKYKLSNDPGFLYEDQKLVSCPLPDQRNKTGSPCFYSAEDIREYNKHKKKGTLLLSKNFISNVSSQSFQSYNDKSFVILNNKVLDVTDYLVSSTDLVRVARNTYSRAFNSNRMFLPLDLSILLFSRMGQDISAEFYKNIANSRVYEACLTELFYRGVANSNVDQGCSRVNLALWITLGLFFIYFLVKMNLANLSRLKFMQKFLYKATSSNDISNCSQLLIRNGRLPIPHVLLFIPCFAESSSTIRETFDSLARTNFPESKKLLVFVCDGIVKSKKDTKENYLCILEALGYSSSNDPEPRAYTSLGQGSRRVNYAKVFAGFYESGSNRVPFLIIVKVGSPSERESSLRIPGNRGKRDSMILLLGFLERCGNLAHNRITPLEFEIFNQCYNLLGIDPREIKYMLVTDADTQVQDDVILKLVSRMEMDPKVAAISGHIRPANPEENLLTMLQIFPFYMTFFSGLAYEACLGRVTTLNGGLAMYRIWSTVENKLLCENQIEMTPTSTKLKRVDLSKWPKVSDEILPEKNHMEADRERIGLDDTYDNSSSDDNSKSTNSNTTTTVVSRKKSHRRRRIQEPRPPLKKKQSEALNFAFNPSIQLCCAHPTVLRGFAAMKPDTMHMENILLLGEEQYFSLILLKSLPAHHLAFDPEAVGYATIPTNFFALQALMIRNIRASFHIQMEFLFTARYLGPSYWIVSFTKLLDIIFTMPLTIYLYSVFIRYFIYKYLVFSVIALAFTWLICMYIIYFLLRLQIKSVVWLLLFCIFSVPFFNVYFPLLAVWCSDYADYWYDVHPTKLGGYCSRLHGIVTDEKTEERIEEDEETEAESSVMRMRLSDFEVVEAEKAARREKEQAALLDAKFLDFTGFVNTTAVNTTGHKNKLSWSSTRSSITVPPSAQIKDRIRHSRYASEDLLSLPSTSSPTRPSSMNSFYNPHDSLVDDPFDDAFGDHRQDRTPPFTAAKGHHRKTSSARLSNLYRRSLVGGADNVYENTSNNPINHYRTHSDTSAIANISPSSHSPNRDEGSYSIDDNDSIVSLNPSIISSVFSLEATAELPGVLDTREDINSNRNPHRIISGTHDQSPHQSPHAVMFEGRSAPIHSRFVNQSSP